jgi:hypothetical protein
VELSANSVYAEKRRLTANDEREEQPVIQGYYVPRTIADHLCGLVVRVLGCRSRGPGSIPGTTRKKVVGLERGSLSLVSTTEELLDRKVTAPV